MIPLLDAVLQKAAEYTLDEVAIGMPHRGRLNVLANVMGKSYAKIFSEFEGNMDTGTVQGSGDVKYHLGASGMFKHPDRNAAVRGVAHLQPQPPGGRESGSRGHRPCQAGPHQQG